MRQVLLRAASLLRRPAVLAIGLLLVIGGSALVALPLFEVPGYELSEALALGVGLLGGAVGAAAAFQERRILLGQEPRPAGALAPSTALSATGRPLAAALLLNAAFVAVPFVAATVFALASTRCDPFALAGFYPLLTLPSAALASAAGVLAGLRARRGLFAAGHYLGLVLLSALLTAWPLVFGPQVFAVNHFGGYLPGPLYDEALAVRAPVYWFRLQTLLAVGLLWFAGAGFLDLATGRLGRPRRLAPLALALACALGFALMERAAPSLGFRMSELSLEERLGGTRVTEHFVLTFPRGKPREEVDRLVRDAELRFAQVASFLGAAPPWKIHVFLYRSAEEKQELVGAAHTQFAKPWLHQIHINDADFPHPSLKHELVHVMAAPFGAGPFHVTTRLWAWPQMGAIEGMAVAGDDPVDELTLHGWAAGMRRQKLAPDIRFILGPKGFYASAPQRAYTLVGSFFRWLADTHGPAKLTALYAHADFQGVYGRSLDELATEWERFLDAVPLDDAAVNQAFARFRRGSLFVLPCAREVALLQSQATEFLASDPARALELYRRCAKLQPDEPSFKLAEADALARLGRRPEAAELLDALQAKVKDAPSLSADVALAQAELAFQQQRPDDARRHLLRALELDPSSAVDRTARLKLATLGTPSGPPVWAYFRQGKDEVRLLTLREALDRDPKNPYIAYLLGRRMALLSAPKLALAYLTRTLEAENLPDSLHREALRLKIESLYRMGDCDGVRNEVGQLPDLGAAFKARATEWLARCDFEQHAFKGPLVPEEPFR